MMEVVEKFASGLFAKSEKNPTHFGARLNRFLPFKFIFPVVFC